ncbi:hypothetical protein [Bacillus sp. OR-18]|uniref:hypothetical protein n=1 Tax=Bacillus sp. OR-18 TaxID=3029191 RepID=UPI00259FB3C4|nr:hypothetical protein [Bacillus sp. OR-18]MDM5038908.1 hypothetical protein [Bacillus sp. OR-18]
MTTKEYSVLELCEEVLHIKQQTFKNSKSKYMKQLEQDFDIEIKKKKPMIYALTPKEKSPQQKADEEFLEILGCDIGRRDIELIKFLLKSILEKKIVPVQEELTHWALQEHLIQSSSRGVVKSYMEFFNDNNIIVPFMAIPVWDDNEIGNRKYDPETGEIYPTYHKVVANKIYYDYAENGVGGYRKRLGERAQEAIDSAYNVILRERFQKEIVPMIKKQIESSIIEKAKFFLRKKVLQEVGEAYGLNRCVRIYEPIINPRIQGQLKSYFGLNKQEQFGMDIEIDTSHIKVVDVKRQVGTKPTEIEAMMEYHLLLKSHAQLYKNNEYAMPLNIYTKWHKGKVFEDTVHELSVPIVKQDVIIPQDDILESFIKNKQVNEIALQQCESQYTNEGTPTFDKDLAAFKFKPQSDVTPNDMKNIMLKGMMNKQRGVMQYDDRTND